MNKSKSYVRGQIDENKLIYVKNKRNLKKKNQITQIFRRYLALVKKMKLSDAII